MVYGHYEKTTGCVDSDTKSIEQWSTRRRRRAGAGAAHSTPTIESRQKTCARVTFAATEGKYSRRGISARPTGADRVIIALFPRGRAAASWRPRSNNSTDSLPARTNSFARSRSNLVTGGACADEGRAQAGRDICRHLRWRDSMCVVIVHRDSFGETPIEEGKRGGHLDVETFHG